MSELGYLRSQNREVIPLSTKMNVIGRDLGCDIIVPHARVAPRHACITFESANHANLRVYDPNLHTAVNGEAIKSLEQKVNLQQGDVLSFGNEFVKYVFTYPEAKRRGLSANASSGSHKIEGRLQQPQLQQQTQSAMPAQLNTSSLETLAIEKYALNGQDPTNIRNIYFPSPIHRLSKDDNFIKKVSQNVEQVPQRFKHRKLKLSSLDPEDFQESQRRQQQQQHQQQHQQQYQHQHQQKQKKHFSSDWEAAPITQHYESIDHDKNYSSKRMDKKSSSRVNLSLLEEDDIEELRRESNFLELVKKVLEKEATIIKKDGDIERLENEKKYLQDEAQKKEDRITQLEEYAGKLRKKIELVERDLYEKTIKLENMESAKKSQQELLELRNLLAARDGQISQLQRELDESHRRYAERAPNNTIDQSIQQAAVEKSASFNQKSPPKTEPERKSVEPSAEEKLEDMRLLLEKQAETFQAIIVEQDKRVNEIYLAYLKLLGETKDGKEIDNKKAFDEFMKQITSLQKERLDLADQKTKLASENHELKQQIRFGKMDETSFAVERKSATPYTPEVSKDMSFNLSLIKPNATPPKSNRPPVSFHKYIIEEQPKSLVHKIQELEERLRAESLKSARLQQLVESLPSRQHSSMTNRELQSKKGNEQLLAQKDQEIKHLKEKYDILVRQMKAVHETIIQSMSAPKS